MKFSIPLSDLVPSGQRRVLKLLANGLHLKNQDPASLLKKAGLRSTRSRVALLRFFASDTRHQGPFTVEQVHQAIKKTGTDLVTVYRGLETFEKHRLIKKCHFGDGFARYEANDDSHHHHHVVCTRCRSTRALSECDLLEQLEKRIKALGYEQVSHSLEFFGVCQGCRS